MLDLFVRLTFNFLASLESATPFRLRLIHKVNKQPKLIEKTIMRNERLKKVVRAKHGF
jgi:hypothetical protein